MTRKPVNLDFIHAAEVPLGARTAWQAMFDVATRGKVVPHLTA